MAVQKTDECVVESSPPDIPDELQQTTGCHLWLASCHLWLANLELSAGTPPSVRLKPEAPRQPHPQGPTTMTMSLLRDAHTQLEAARAS